MPELSRFYGIVIQMYFGDHQPPHFHARYGGKVVKIGIDPTIVIDGILPKRAMDLVLEWAALHRHDLLDAFSAVTLMQSPAKIAPLE